MAKPKEGKRDQGKLRWDLLPWGAVKEAVGVLTLGAKKYSDHGWKAVVAGPKGRQRYFAAAQRHLVAWYEGERKDPGTGLHHLAHASCCILFLLWHDQTDV